MATKNNGIQENLKKYFYSGVGLAAHTAEVFQKSVDELVKKGKMNEADGKRIVRDTMKKVNARRPEIEAKYHATVHKLVTTTTAEMGKLQKRIQQLEGQLSKKTAPAKAASGKSVTKAVKKVAKRKAVKRKPAKPKTTNTDSGTGDAALTSNL